MERIMGYTAGSLELSVFGKSDKAVLAIKNTVKSLNSLNRAILQINNASYSFAGKQLDYIFTKIAKASSKIQTSNLENFASVAKSINSISRLSNLGKVDWDDVAKGFSKMTTAIIPFIEAVKSGETSLNALYGTLNKISKGSTTSGSSASNKAFKNFNLGFSFAKIRLALAAAKRLGQSVYKVVQYGSDFVETLNLWQVSMRDNIHLADQFVSKMNKAYGVSTQTLMNAQAIFRNMLGSLGQISDTSAYALSESLTQMALDFSSLYNVKISEALEKFQAMLAGQVRPIRSAGLDITETTLFMYYQQLGGTKTMRQLNRTEKQLLSILAVFKQMEKAGALGDMAKTIETFANQARMASENFKEMLTWIGVSLQYLIQESKILVKLNALLISFTEIFKSLAYQIGYKTPDFAFAWEENIQETSEAIDELQGKLLGFDEFRALNDSTDNSVLSIDETLLDVLASYSSFIGEANSGAQELANKWLTILGFQKDAESGLWQAPEEIKNIFGIIKDSLNDIKPELSATMDYIGDTFPGVLELTTTALENLNESIIPLASTITKIVWGTSQLTDNAFPLINSVVDIIGTILSMVLGFINAVSYTANFILFYIEPIITSLVVIFTAIVDFFDKLISTIGILMDALLNWNWKNLGTRLKDNWSDWENTTQAWNTHSETFYNNWGEGAWDRFVAENYSPAYSSDTGYANTQTDYSNSTVQTPPNITVTIDGREVFYAVQDTGKQLGYEMAQIR
jgi:hypothetical protein